MTSPFVGRSRHPSDGSGRRPSSVRTGRPSSAQHLGARERPGRSAVGATVQSASAASAICSTGSTWRRVRRDEAHRLGARRRDRGDRRERVHRDAVRRDLGREPGREPLERGLARAVERRAVLDVERRERRARRDARRRPTRCSGSSPRRAPAHVGQHGAAQVPRRVHVDLEHHRVPAVAHLRRTGGRSTRPRC